MSDVSARSQGASRVIARNAVYNLAGQVLVAIIAIISVPHIVRGLGPESYGLLSIAIVILGSMLLLELGLGRATTKFVAAANAGEDVGAVVWASLRLQLFFGALAGVALAVLTPWLTTRVLKIDPALIPDAQRMFRLLAAVIPIVLITSTFRGALEGAQRFGITNAVKVLINGATYAVPAAAVVTNMRVSTIVLLLVITRTAAAIIYFLACVRVLPGVGRVRLRGVPEGLLAFAGWVAVSNLLIPLLSQIDRYMIGAVVSVETVTFYAIPFEILNGLWIVPGAITAAIFPVFSRQQTEENMRELFVRSLKYLLVVLGPMCILLSTFAFEVLAVWQGAGVARQSATVLSIMSIAVLTNSLGWIPGALLTSSRADVVAKMHVVQMLAYVAVCYLMTRTWGLAGTAFSFTLRVTIETIVLMFAARLRLPEALQLLRTLVVPAATLALYAAAVVAAKLVGASLAVALVGAAVASVLFIIAAWAICFDQFDRTLARDILAWLGRRSAPV